MPGAGIPHVVDSVEESATAEFETATGSVMDIIAEHGDVVCGACKVDGDHRKWQTRTSSRRIQSLRL